MKNRNLDVKKCFKTCHLILLQVSILLKESFIDAFPSKDQPFMKVLPLILFAKSSFGCPSKCELDNLQLGNL